MMSRSQKVRKSKIPREISRRIRKYGSPQHWEKECYDLHEEFLKSHSTQIGKPVRLIDSILLLLCKRNRLIESKELLKTTRGQKGSSASKSLHFFKILETLNGLAPATAEDYVTRFFVDNSEYEEFLPKALDIASKLPRKYQSRNPRILASVCIYASSIGTLYSEHRPLITQSEVATFFKITKVGVRKTYHDLLPKLKEMDTMLSEEEIEWLLSFRKKQLKRFL